MKYFRLFAVAMVLATMGTMTLGAPAESDSPLPEKGLISFGGKARSKDPSYYLSTFRATKAQAQLFCRQQGLDLLNIKNHLKQDDVFKQYRDYWGTQAPDWVWLNADQPSCSGGFVWGDGTSVQYSNFVDDYQSVIGGCVVLIGPNGVAGRNQFRWTPVACVSTGYFVCEPIL